MKKKEVVSISMENTKMGPIPSFSLPPIVSCRADAPCKKGCYARRIYLRRKSVRSAWDRNLRIAKRGDEMYRQVTGWLNIYQPKAFRIHVGGDFFSEKYLLDWARIARENPSVSFFTFTKQFDILRKCVAKLPKNLSIILSAWVPGGEDWCPPKDLMRKFPVAWVWKDASGIDYIMSAMESVSKKRRVSQCEGHCATCGKCFKAKKSGGDIVFDYH